MASSPLLLLPFVSFLGSSVAIGKFVHQAQAEVASDPLTLSGSIAAGIKVIGYAAVGTKAIAHTALGIKGVGYVAAGIKAIGHSVAVTKVATGIKAIAHAAARTKAVAQTIATIKTKGHVAAVGALAVAKSGKAINAATAVTAYRTGLVVGRATASASPDDQDSTNQDATGEGGTGNEGTFVGAGEGLASDNLFYNLEL